MVKAVLNKRIAMLLAPLLVLGVGVGGYFYWQNRGDDTYKPNPANQIKGIDYSPGKAEDNAEINRKKESGELEAEPPAPTGKATIVFSAAGQDSPGGPLIVSPILANITSGECELTLTQGAKTMANKTAKIIISNNYITCDGFEIPFADLGPGTYKLKLAVTAADGTVNDATKFVTIN